MGVGVQREGRIGVAQDAGQGLGVHAAGEGVGGEGVAERVKMKILKGNFEAENNTAMRLSWRCLHREK